MSAERDVVNERDMSGAIAIVGMAGRFPGAESVAELWTKLVRGEECIERLSDDELRAAGVDDATFDDPNYVKACAFLADPDLFDAGFFDVTPREAELMDPQQRAFLEVAWSAFEDAGYDVSRFDGAIGVFAGTGKNHYYAEHLLRNPRALEAMGPVATTIASEKDFVATRVSYKLDLTGPSVSVQTACSTSLVAVHLACQSLINGESDMALAGGASITSFARRGYTFVDGGIFSPDGHLRAFDAKAAGQVGGNGVAAVVLKRYADAVEDGDAIRAVILASALNNDGVRKVSFNAPGVDGQAQVIAEALEVADVEPESISYVECHGTGTHLGDPIEVAALTQAYRARTDAVGFCGLGSLKTNVGHLDAAAGVSGLIKAALALAHEQVPPSLHFETPNPELKLDTSPFFVDAELRAWKRGSGSKGPRRAGVSSFGMGGTNAHAILEEGPERLASETDAPQLLVLSARTESALGDAAARLADALEADPTLALADVAHTLQQGRKAFGVRRALGCVDREDALAALRDARRGARGSVDRDVVEGAGAKRDVAFLFSGQGSQYAGMARGLYDAGGVFREAVDRCCDALAPRMGLDLRTLLFASTEASIEAADAELEKTQNTQPALFVIEYALAQALAALGVEPDAMLGHSIGEYVAACLAGVMSLDDALALVAARGRLIGSLPVRDEGDPSVGGAMLAVPLSEEAVQSYLEPGVTVAVINAPELVAVAGPVEALEATRKRLRADKVAARQLHTSHAFHSPLMDPILDAFEAEVCKVKLSAPDASKGRVISCTTARELTAAEATDPKYWVRHLREAVRFADGARALADADAVLVEVGPGQALTSLARLTAPDADVVSTTRHPRDARADGGRGDAAAFLETLGGLWCAGVDVGWSALHAAQDGPRARVPLPTYPFERKRYWIDPDLSASVGGDRAARLADPADWFWAPTWQRALAPQTRSAAPGAFGVWAGADDSARPARVLIVADASHAAAAADLAARCDAHEARAAIEFVDASTDRARFDALLAEHAPDEVLVLDTLARPRGAAHRDDDGRESDERAFYRPLALVQAAAERAQPLHVTFVTAGAHDVFGDLSDPEGALVVGVAKAANAELGEAGVTCRVVDLDRDVVEDAQDDWIDALVHESANHEPLVALRAGQRFVPSLARVAAPAAQLPELDERPVVLVTGGLGGVGRSLALALARSAGDARLVLLSRSELPARDAWDAWTAEHGARDATARRIQAVRDMEAAGAEVLLATGDVADEDDVRGLFEDIEARFGRLDGVIHAAGTPGDGLLALKTRAAAAAVLDPKVEGLRTLGRALGERSSRAPVRFFALCSSLATALDAVGQVDYFAANAFLDACASDRECRRGATRVVSIGWEAWRDSGMAAEGDTSSLSAALRAERAASLRLGLSADEGFDVLLRALATGLSHVLVSTRDLPARIDAQREETRATTAGDGASAAAASHGSNGRSSAHERPDIATAFVAPASDTEHALAAMWADLLGIDRVGTGDDFFELGGNSLLLMQVSARLRSHFDVTVSMRELFDTPTVASLSERVEALRLLEGMEDDELTADDGASVETEEFKL